MRSFQTTLGKHLSTTPTATNSSNFKTGTEHRTTHDSTTRTHTQHDPRSHHVNITHNQHHNNYIITPFQPEDVQSLLKRSPRLPRRPSGFTLHVLRRLPPNIITAITNLYNASFAGGNFPIPFKTANIRLIPKPNKALTDPTSYRPISLLNGLGKALDRLILSRLKYHLKTNDFIPHTQFGFRPHTSTEDTLNAIITHTDS